MKNPLLDVNLHTCYANKNICARIFHPEGLPQDVQRSSENKLKVWFIQEPKPEHISNFKVSTKLEPRAHSGGWQLN